MFYTLFLKEIRGHVLTFRFGAALLTSFLLIIVSVWVLGEDYRHRLDAYNLAAETATRSNSEVYVYTQVSPLVHRPPAPLSIFAQGEDRRFGNSVKVKRWEVPRQATGSFNDNLLLAARPHLDLLAIFTIVMSLFGILFGYDGIAGEREGGTLKLLVSGKASRATVFASKYLAGSLSLALPFLLSFVAGLILLVFQFNFVFSSDQFMAIAAMALAGVIYGSAFLALALACSAFVKWSSTALVLSLFLWALGVIVIPAAAPSIAGAVTSLPSPNDIEQLEKATAKEVNDRLTVFNEKYQNWGSGWTGGWNGEGYYQFDGNEIQHRDGQEFIRFYEPQMIARADRIWNAVSEQQKVMKQQAEVADLISLTAPAYHLRKAFTSLAGTGISSSVGFLERVRRYRRELLADFSNRGLFGANALQFFSRRDPAEIDDKLYQQRVARYRASAMSLGAQWFRTVSPEAWGPLPEGSVLPFEYEMQGPDFVSALWPTAFLIVLNIVMVAAGIAAFTRYDVR